MAGLFVCTQAVGLCVRKLTGVLRGEGVGSVRHTYAPLDKHNRAPGSAEKRDPIRISGYSPDHDRESDGVNEYDTTTL